MSKPASRASATAAAGSEATEAATTNKSSGSPLDQAGSDGLGSEQGDAPARGRAEALSEGRFNVRASPSPVAFYEVMDCPILHDHELYEPGDQLELTDREARSLGRLVRLVRD